MKYNTKTIRKCFKIKYYLKFDKYISHSIQFGELCASVYSDSRKVLSKRTRFHGGGAVLTAV